MEASGQIHLLRAQAVSMAAEQKRGKDTYALVELNFVSCRPQVLGLQQRARRKHYKTLLSEMSATTATLLSTRINRCMQHKAKVLLVV